MNGRVHDVTQEQELDGDPIAQLVLWVLEGADESATAAPTTMVLATADGDGAPHARTVVVTAIGGDGLRFHSSRPTTKTDDLAVNPRASGVLHWPALGRQAVVHGSAETLPDEVSDDAFPIRPRPLQLLGWAYEDLAERPVGPDGEQPPGAVEASFAAAAQRDADDAGPLPRPASWTTVELRPHRVELWRAGSDVAPPRRTRYLRADAGGWRSFPVLP